MQHHNVIQLDGVTGATMPIITATFAESKVTKVLAAAAAQQAVATCIIPAVVEALRVLADAKVFNQGCLDMRGMVHITHNIPMYPLGVRQRRGLRGTKNILNLVLATIMQTLLVLTMLIAMDICLDSN